MSISSKLEKLATDITSAYSAINAKGGTIPSNKNTENLATSITSIPQGSSPILQTKSVTIRQNGSTSVTPDTGYDGLSSVAITTDVSGGGGSVEEKDVNFYDYDGTLTNSYTKTEFLALTELPANPTHQGLTAQGWNWDLTNAKTFVTTYTKLDIGQVYTTDDGKTRIYITLDDANYLSPYVGFAINGTATIEWGDGTSDTVTGTSTTTIVYTQHTYSSIGDYVIKLSSTNKIYLKGSNSTYSYILTKQDKSTIYQSKVQKIEIGTNVDIGLNCFYYCTSLKEITIPNDITISSNGAFSYCFTLQNAVIPNGITSIGNSLFCYCYGLRNVEIPRSVTDLGSSVFNYCSSLQKITISNNVANIGQSAFGSCANLRSITIPSNVTSIGSSVFSSCWLLEKIVILNNSVSANATNSWAYSCANLRSITIPNSVTSIGSSFLRKLSPYIQCNNS